MSPDEVLVNHVTYGNQFYLWKKICRLLSHGLTALYLTPSSVIRKWIKYKKVKACLNYSWWKFLKKICDYGIRWCLLSFKKVQNTRQSQWRGSFTEFGGFDKTLKHKLSSIYRPCLSQVSCLRCGSILVSYRRSGIFEPFKWQIFLSLNSLKIFR